MQKFGKISWLKERIVIQEQFCESDEMGGEVERWEAKTLAWGQISQLQRTGNIKERLRLMMRSDVPLVLPARVAWKGRLYQVISSPFRCHQGHLKSCVIEAITSEQKEHLTTEVVNNA